MKFIQTVPAFVFLLISLVFFWSFFAQGKLPIAADTIVGLYHPYRDFYAGEYPNGIPFKNFLITDPVRQQYPWRKLSLEAFRIGQLPVWNPYSGMGTPLAANVQSAPYYPLNALLFVLPFSQAWSLLVISQVFLSGLFLYLYLRIMKLSRLASFLGGITFSLCGFSISWMTWNTVMHVALWLPLILLAQEKLLRKFSVVWMIILLFAGISSFSAGHIQTLFYLLLISNSYLLCRIIQLAWSKNSLLHSGRKAIRMYLPFLLIGIVVLVLTSIVWYPTFSFIQDSARSLDQTEWGKEGWFIPWQHLVQFIAPDFFGNPSTLNYWGTWNYAELVGYVGIFPLLMGIFALFFRRDPRTAYFGTLFFLSLLFATPTFLAKLPFYLAVPFLSTSQPTRLLFVADFSLAVLAALGLEMLLLKKRSILAPMAFFGASITALWGVVIFFPMRFGITPEQAGVVVSNLKLPSILIGVTIASLAVLLLSRGKKIQIAIVTFLIVLSTFDLIRFGWKFTPFTSSSYLYPVTRTLSFLKEDKSLYRIMSVDNRILPPNFSTAYKIASVDLYDPLYLQRYGEFIAASERGKPDIAPPFGFNRIITPQNIDSLLLDLMNVKYVLALQEIDDVTFKKVFQEGQTRVYENRDVLPRAFFVKDAVLVTRKQQAINSLFQEQFDPEITAVFESDSTMESKKNLPIGRVEILEYTENLVKLKTSNSGDGFLVFADVYYSAWKAYRESGGNVVPLHLYQTDFLFRGMFVPKGEQIIIMRARR